VTGRPVGAFLVALIAIGYLFGSFEGGLDFLIALLVAAAFAVVVELWLGRGEGRDALAPGDFDERATKRAVRRGVARTALTAVVWVALGLFGLQIVSVVWQTRGDRGDHFALVVGHGVVAARPGFAPSGPASCCNTGLRSLEALVTVDPKIASPVERPLELRLELDLRGRLDDDPLRDLPATGVDAALAADPTASAFAVSRLDDLPDGAVATAILELRRPLDPDRFHRLLARSRGEMEEPTRVAVYLQPAERPQFELNGVRFDERVSWPTPAVAAFQAWVKALRPDDDGVLDLLGLPPVAELERIAATPRIHGFVLDHATPARLRALAADPAVRTVALGDVAFNLTGSGP
jgi:hypothetical protein